MINKTLGNTGIKLSAIGLGTWAIGGEGKEYGWGPQDDKDSIATIRRAVELGVNWIDTAPVYGCGHSEEIVARALEGIRDNVLISTKFGMRWDENEKVFFSLKKDSVRFEIEESLRRLKTDVIDFYMIHMPLPEEEIEEAWGTLADLVKEGKVRYAGASSFTLEQLKNIQKIYPATFVLAHYNMLERSIENDFLDFCSGNHIGVFVYCPMYRGLLTGKFSAEKVANLPEGDHRREDPHFKEPFLSADLDFVGRLRPIAQRNNKTLAQLAVAWTLRRPEVTSAIVGARNSGQIQQTIPAGDWVLSEKEIKEISNLLQDHQTALRALDK